MLLSRAFRSSRSRCVPHALAWRPSWLLWAEGARKAGRKVRSTDTQFPGERSGQSCIWTPQSVMRVGTQEIANEESSRWRANRVDSDDFLLYGRQTTHSVILAVCSSEIFNRKESAQGALCQNFVQVAPAVVNR